MLGYELGERWETVATQLKQFDLAIGVVIVIAMFALAARFVIRRRREQAQAVRENKPD
jgi:membrane protein DedA with SNARE-associated domain